MVISGGDGMINDMGIFRTNIEIASGADPSRRMELRDVMVDTGSEYNWIPGELLVALGVAPVRIDRFETADGRILERPVGLAYIFAGGRSAATMVVFSNPGEMVLLGAHGLEGLNLRVDLSRRELIPAGPMPVAAAAWTSCFSQAAARICRQRGMGELRAHRHSAHQHGR